MSVDPDLVRIYVGADPSQMLGVEVLKYSIQKHSTLPVEVYPMLDLGLPEPKDPRQGQRTGFSFARFAIPRLAGYQGRALYLDADMQVFSDIKGLWQIPMGNARVVIQEDLSAAEQHVEKEGAPQKRIRQCSVMLLDCARLNWVPEEIIAGLGVKYNYEELLYHLCILKNEDIEGRIPFTWNSLEHWDEQTNLIHYTDMYTQPWVSNRNPFGWVWVRELKEMVAQGLVPWSRIELDAGLGYIRPSLLVELKEAGEPHHADPDSIKRMDAIDERSKFVMHREVYENKKKRQVAIKVYEQNLKQQGLDPSSMKNKDDQPIALMERLLKKIASMVRSA